MPKGIYIRTKEHGKNISKANLGRKLTEEQCKKISKAISGKKRSKEFCDNLNKRFKNKNLLIKRNKKISETLKGREFSKKTIQKMSKAREGKTHLPETKLKMRKSAIKRVFLGNGKLPAYNKQACEIFKQFDLQNNTKGRFAIYGDGEFYIQELGYWLDYINFDLKLIIEVDEKHHRKQQEKDLIRQQEIQNFYPDFKFVRFKDSEMNKILEEKHG